jgi:hypothetical protein
MRFFGSTSRRYCDDANGLILASLFRISLARALARATIAPETDHPARGPGRPEYAQTSVGSLARSWMALARRWKIQGKSVGMC